MKGENEKFLKGPRAFMADRILQVDSLYSDPKARTPIRNGLLEFDIMEYKYHRHYGAQRQTTVDASKYCIIIPLEERENSLKPEYSRPKTTGRHGTKPIEGYYLGWNSGACYTHQIGNDADFLFTPLLSGCTFYAAGNNKQVMTVAHLNTVSAGADPITVESASKFLLKGESLLRTQDDIEDEITIRNLSTKLYRYALRPVNYRGTEESQEDVATVVGIRNRRSHEWKFHYQTWRNLGKSLQLIAAEAVPRVR